ncbi:MAG: MarR family transcriptional regulator [Clostridia bacterium]|nr:MarR family transcriptional regulator [Clostridia bacterium]
MGSEEWERTQLIKEDIDALIHTMRLHHRVVERRIDGLGVHHSQHRMLMRLSCLGRSVSQRELADAIDVSPACVARMLKPLAAAGLVEKAGGTDGRRNEISVSADGMQLVEDSKAVFRQIGEQMFAGLNEEDLQNLGQLLNRLKENLSNMDKPGAGEGNACPDERS